MSASVAVRPQNEAPVSCAALAAFDDAAALIDQRTRTLRWTSAAWLALLPRLTPGTTLAVLDEALPGLAAARSALVSDARPRRLCIGDARQWESQLVLLAPDQVLLRLADRREQSRALQRQLDDREQLLFTSRVLSVGEMATTLAHELNQPIGATANLLRGLRARLVRSNGKPNSGASAGPLSRLSRGLRGRPSEGPRVGPSTGPGVGPGTMPRTEPGSGSNRDLSRGLTAGLSAEEFAALDSAIEQVMFAARVIARIREFTHSHQPRPTSFDLTGLLRASASLLDWDVQRTGARLTLELPAAPVQVRGDEVMLQQVIVNLMRNALDALRTDPPADPQIALRMLTRAHEVELQVRDNGCGLGDEAAARLFVPFASSKPSGMGLGLSICRSFVELHQGRLWFSRNADRGATFHVRLPLPAR
ncbi:MAG TPA: ATP-binding protein [Burkholderiaceae bacterium]|nr:ATP-binding protein [Burkholderiaceae bacterium]